MQNTSFDVILFDLGGVLIELVGIPRLLEWTRQSMTVEELWRRWLHSPSVQLFESGRCTPNEFAASMCTEFELPVTAGVFLEQFSYWALRPYPGASDLLRSLSSRFRIASLSNTNVVHWKHICETMDLVECFHINFPSYEIGLVKPERAIFEHVIATLNCPPERIVFFDDNQLNIDQASAVGMRSYRVSGLADTIAKANELGLLNEFDDIYEQ